MPDQKPIAYDAYQAMAENYAARIDTKPHNAFYDRPAMLGMLPDVSGKRVLDVGCGPGAYAEAITQRGATVDACDISKRMLELAAQRLQSQILESRARLHLLDLNRPLSAFQEAQFDLVLAPLCLDYIEDWGTLFREFFRLLKPAGIFLFSVSHPAFNATYFNTHQYFSVEHVVATWRGFGVNINMPSYRRSWEDALNPLCQAGFVLECLHEPRPTEEFRRVDPMNFLKLMHRPAFLCVRARKK